jgi:NAD+ synthase
MSDWVEEQVETRWTKTAQGWRCDRGEVQPLADHPEDIYSAMVLSLRDYVDRNGFPGVVLGLSGGIDSAACAAIAVDALGPERVWCVMLPSRYTSTESLVDATECARLLGCRYDTIPIVPAVAAFGEMLGPVFKDVKPDLTEENLQSRIRGVTLMALSNKFGPMLVTTGNKSEMSVGYATIYGDMAGGYNPLKDAYKTTVFAISRWRNTHQPKIGLGPAGVVIPENIITKPPTAELRAEQKDSDSLPPYDVLDPILLGLVENEKSVEQVVSEGFDRETVVRIERLLHLAEYKRRQAPPGVKLGTRNFGRDRRYPITHAFRNG